MAIIKSLKKLLFLLPFITSVSTGCSAQPLSSLQQQAPPPAAAKPNVIFILADDLAWGDLACFGNTKIATPNLDRLASKGTLFTNFYVDAPVCAPSRASFFTGKYPENCGAYTGDGALDISVPLGLDNLSKTFKQAGYKTAHIGKWHLSPEKTPDEYGFDKYKIREAKSWGNLQKDPYFRANSATYFTDDAIEFIEEGGGKPFYIQLWEILPHDILFPTEEQMAVYEKYDMRKRFNIPGFEFTSAEQIYYASVTALDRGIGKLLNYLDSTGLSKNTLIVFTSDNGPGIMESIQCGHSAAGNTGPFRGRKFSIYEGGIRMPLIVSLPGKVPQGVVDDKTIMAGIDFLPSFASVIGAKTPAPIDGQDMSAAWWGKQTDRKEPLFWRWRWMMPPQLYHRSPALAMRNNNWKLLMNPDGSRVELYDLSVDPTELDNRSKEHPKLALEMQKKLIEWNKTLPAVKFEAGAGQNDYNWPKSKQ